MRASIKPRRTTANATSWPLISGSPVGNKSNWSGNSFKTNSKSQTSYGPKSTLWTRMLNFYNENRDEFLSHYHKRSNVETTFHMIKSKFGQRLRSKTMTAQINEALCKVLCHNLCVVIQSMHEFGVETNFEMAEAA